MTPAVSRSSPRTTELGLILLVALITTGAYILAGFGTLASLPVNIGPFLVIILALLVAAHVATRRLAPHGDRILLPLACLLNGIGYVIIARLDENLAGLQSTWTAVGIGAYIATLFLIRRTRDLERYRYSFMLLGVALLLMPLLPVIGRNINGARIWVRLGPLSFQPGELAKIALALFFASYLIEKRELLGKAARHLGPIALPKLRHLGPVLLAWGASMVVMMAERDLGSSLLFFTFFVVMLWVATERSSYLVLGTLLFSAGATVAWQAFAHVQVRVSMWLDPWQNISQSVPQIAEATFAMAWGGIAGTGLGLGQPQRIPASATDFIFAAIGEELGLLGTTAIIISFVLIVGTGLRIALRATNPFDKLLATGLTSIIGFQAFIIIGGVIRLVPLTGITLPFVSYGGSSLVANYILVALLMRISNATYEQAQEEATNTPVDDQYQPAQVFGPNS